MTDICDCQQCTALCDHPGCTALAVLIDDYGEGWCRPHLENKRDREAEQADEDFREKWHGGLNPYLYHGERYEAARDHYWDQRIDEARGK